MPPERLTRFAAGASVDTRQNFGKALLAALDRLGVQPGQDFIILPAHEQPSLLDQSPQEQSHDAPALGPFTRDSATSRQAALDNYPRSGKQRHAVLMEIARAGDLGRTRDELTARLQFPDSSTDARVLELKNAAFIEETEQTRTTRAGSQASVLVLTARGRAEVRVNDPEHLGG